MAKEQKKPVGQIEPKKVPASEVQKGKKPKKGECGWHGRDYGEKCKDGDIIKMTLNMNELTLSYQVNDKDLGNAYENIENTAYRAAVTMERDSSLTLIRFEQI